MHAIQPRHRFCSCGGRPTMNILRFKYLRPLFAACLALLASASSFAQAAAPAPASTPAPVPSLEQRIAGIEAYLANGDPGVVLKDAKGTVPAGLTTPAV